ncbi:MAG: hypothetical protein J6T20_00080 [Treponema sp.]|nr:hypothetical protein [Treponema sp.]
MKKNKLWLAAVCLAICAFMNISCASTNFAEPEKFQDQSYKLTSINFMSDISITSKDDAVIFFENFPVEALKSALLENYNIDLDENIFDKEKLADNLVALVSKKESGEETILGWSLSDPQARVADADEIIKKYKRNAKISEEDLAAINEVYNHIATLDVKLFTQMSNTTKGLSMLVNLINNYNEVMPYAYVDEYWTPVHVIADKSTAAKVGFSSAIKPAYIIIDNQIITFAAYAKDNSADKEGVYIDSGKQVTIVTTVNDPGVFMLYDPVTFYSRKIETTFEANKTYSVKHKVTNRMSTISNWDVEFSFE